MVRFGVIGTNWITDSLIEAASLHPEFTLAAVYSRSGETAAAFGAKYGVTTTFTSLELMAESGAIDAVYIASPNALHCPQALVFLERGIPVLCEKPIACSCKELRAMHAAADKTGALLMQALKNTLTPRFIALKETLPRLGKIQQVTACRCQYSRRYDDYKKGIIQNAFKPELGNGAMMDLGIYIVQPLVHLFGGPSSIQCEAQLLSTGVDGCGSLVARFGDMLATLSFSKISSSFAPSEIMGEEGSLLINSALDPQSLTLRLKGQEPENIPFQQVEQRMFYEVAEFISLLKAGKTQSEVNSRKDELAAMAVIEEYRRRVGIVYP